MRLHQGVYLDFCNSLEIYYFTLDLFPTVHSMDGISCFLRCPTHCVVTGPSCNHWAGTWHHEPTPCRRVQTDMGWDDPTHVYPVVLQEPGIRQVSILWPQTLGAFSYSMGSQDFALLVKKKQGWGKKRCLPCFPACAGVLDAARVGINDACGSPEPLALGRCIWASQALAHKTCDKWSKGLLAMYCCTRPHKPARMCGNTGCLLGCLLVK